MMQRHPTCHANLGYISHTEVALDAAIKYNVMPIHHIMVHRVLIGLPAVGLRCVFSVAVTGDAILASTGH
jgi:hypothetical protein